MRMFYKAGIALIVGFTGCGQLTPGWSVTGSDGAVLPQGHQYSMSLRLEPATVVNQTLNLEVKPSNSKLTVSLSQTRIIIGTPVTLTIEASDDTPPGQYGLELISSDGAMQKVDKLKIVVVERIACPPNLYACDDGMTISIPALPKLIRGVSTSFKTNVSRPISNPRRPSRFLNSSVVFSIIGEDGRTPEVWSVKFTPPSTAIPTNGGIGEATLGIVVPNSTPIGKVSMTLQATGNLGTFVTIPVEFEVINP
jgi:hypothetical protein